MSQEYHLGSSICLSLSLGALGRENEEKFPGEQEFHRLEEIVLALLHLFGGNKQKWQKLDICVFQLVCSGEAVDSCSAQAQNKRLPEQAPPLTT